MRPWLCSVHCGPNRSRDHKGALACIALPGAALCHQAQGFPLPHKDALRKLVGTFGKIVRSPIDRFYCPSQLSRRALRLVTHCRAALLSPVRVQEKHQTAAQTDSRDPRDETCFALHWIDRKSTRLNSSHLGISYAVFCLTKKN